MLDPERSIEIGIQGAAEPFWEFSYDSGMTVIHIEDVVSMGIDNVIHKAREVIGDGPTYITFDVDGLDPVYAPGTGTPEIGGLSTREAIQIYVDYVVATLSVVTWWKLRRNMTPRPTRAMSVNK